MELPKPSEMGYTCPVRALWPPSQIMRMKRVVVLLLDGEVISDQSYC